MVVSMMFANAFASKLLCFSISYLSHTSVGLVTKSTSFVYPHMYLSIIASNFLSIEANLTVNPLNLLPWLIIWLN